MPEQDVPLEGVLVRSEPGDLITLAVDTPPPEPARFAERTELPGASLRSAALIAPSAIAPPGVRSPRPPPARVGMNRSCRASCTGLGTGALRYSDVADAAGIWEGTVREGRKSLRSALGTIARLLFRTPWFSA